MTPCSRGRSGNSRMKRRTPAADGRVRYGYKE